MSDGITDSIKNQKTFHDKQLKLIQFLSENGYDWSYIRSDKFEVTIP